MNTNITAINKQAAKYKLELVKGHGYFYWKSNDPEFGMTEKRLMALESTTVLVHTVSQLQKHQWLWELQDILKMIDAPFYPRAHSEDWYLSPGTRKSVIRKYDDEQKRAYAEANFRVKVEDIHVHYQPDDVIGCSIKTTYAGRQWSNTAVSCVEHAELLYAELGKWIEKHQKN